MDGKRGTLQVHLRCDRQSAANDFRVNTVALSSYVQQIRTVATQLGLSEGSEALLGQVLSKATAYTALTEKLSPLESIIADERTRYQAAYALIKGCRLSGYIIGTICTRTRNGQTA